MHRISNANNIIVLDSYFNLTKKNLISLTGFNTI